MLVAAGSAGAATTHVPGPTIDGGAIGNPRSVAVDNATGDVYVLDASDRTVHRFDSAGNAKNFSLLGANKIDGVSGADDTHHGFLNATGIAVDNSSGPNKGVLYVAAGGNYEVDAFLPSGKFAGALTANSDEAAVEFGNGGEFCGVAVSPDGSVFVSHARTWFNPPLGFVDKFRPSAWIPDSTPAQNFPVKSTLQDLPENPCNIAVDASNAAYLDTSGLIGTSQLRRYPASVFNVEDPAGKLVDPQSNGSAVDVSSGDVYVNQGGRIARYDDDLALQEVFGEGAFALQAGGVGVNPGTGTVYATDLIGGDIRTFVEATTPDVDDIGATTTATGATISATVGDAGAGTVTSCTVEFGPTVEYGTSEPCTPAPSGSSTAVTVSISGLTTETGYHYRIKAGNAAGVTASLDRVFTTHAVAGLSAEDPSEVTQSSAVLNGSFVGDGDPVTYHFEWGPDAGYGNETPPESAGAGTGPQPVSAPIEGLGVYTTYHYRVVATNSAGTTYSEDREFTSAPPFLPLVSDTAASAITPTAADFSASVNPGLGDTVYLFEYGPTSDYGSQTPTSDSIGSDQVDHPVGASVTGLEPGTRYHFRVVAINFGGTTNGPDVTFVTPNRPRVGGGAATSITETSAVLGATVSPGFVPTTYRFEYGTGTGYGSVTAATGLGAADDLDHAVSAAVSGLTPGTTYHFRAVATNAIGGTAGPDGSFTTVPRPQVAPTPPGSARKCPKGKVKRKGKCVKKKKGKRGKKGHKGKNKSGKRSS